MIRIVTALLLCVGLGGCAPELNWRDVRSDDGRVVQWFPCRPVQQVRTLKLAGRDRRVELRVCDAAGASWAQARVPVGDADEAESVGHSLLRALADNLAAPVAATSFKLPGASARPDAVRGRVEGRGPDGRLLRAGVLLFGAGAGVYQVTVLGSAVTEAAMEQYLTSVRVLP